MSRHPGMTVERKTSRKLCQRCALQGIRSPLHLFQLNDEEALLMCKNVECTFMPSSNWESLVVKRGLPELTSNKKKDLPSSLSSVVSYSTHSAPQLSSSVLKPRSRFPSSLHTQPAGSSLPSGPLAKPPSNFVCGRAQSSPTPSQTDLISGEKTERKTLVPLAPFLCGHAHTFSSFDTKKLEDKRGQRSSLGCDIRSQTTIQTVNKLHHFNPVRTEDFCKSKVKPAKLVGVKRPSSSLDSDSFSSSSGSLGSRPTTPSAEPRPEDSFGGKRVKRIVVAKDTLTKLIQGSLKIELVKPTESTAQGLVLKPSTSTVSAKENCLDPSFQASVNFSSEFAGKQLKGSPETTGFVGTSNRDCGGSENLEITPVGSLEDILKSQVTKSESFPSAAFNSSTSLQSHIDAINSHFQVASSVIGHDGSHKSVTVADQKP